jgi:MYXO-CTERM domain-containing protein
LTFEASNWDVPQPVHVSASNDADADDDVAGIVLRASGVADALVAIRVTDDDPLAILVSKSELSLAVGSSEELSVVLNGRPRLPVAASIVSDDVDAVSVAPSTLRFEPDDWNKPSSIVISARPGSSADSFATVTLAARGFEPARVKVTSRALGAGGEAGGSMTDSSGGAAGGPADAGALGSGGVTEAGGGVTEAGGEAPSGGAPTAPAASIDTSGCGCRYSPQSVPAGLVALLGAAALLARRPRRVLKVCHRRAST